MKTLKRLWLLLPGLLRSLLIAGLVVIMTGISTKALGAQRQPAQLSRPDSHLMARALPGVYVVPQSCSVPIISSIVTEKEIELRQYQADFAKYIEEQAELDRQANLTSSQDLLAIEKFRLDCEIKVLQARQMLEAGNQQSSQFTLELAVTSREVSLRKRQLEIAKQIDHDEIISHEAGVVSLNRVWTARRDRIDAEILMLQATVKQEMQQARSNPE